MKKSKQKNNKDSKQNYIKKKLAIAQLIGTPKTTIKNTKLNYNLKLDNCPTVTVKNAEGEADTTAYVIIQNKINFKPKISVIIPVYNVEKYIRKCLDTVVNQTLKEIEIICIDDGSTDGSLEILKEYAYKDKRITVLAQKNLYAGIARNAGLAVAQGKYLIFLDSDDFFELTLLKDTYQLAIENDTDIVFYQYRNYNNITETFEEIRGINKKFENLEYKIITTKDYTDELFTICNPMPWNKLINKEFIKNEQIYFQGLKASNDICFSLTTIACSSKIGLLFKSLVNYRYNRIDSLKNTRDKNPYDFYKAYKGLYNNLVRKHIYEQNKKTFLTSLVSSSLWTLQHTDKQHQNIKNFIKDTIIEEFSLDKYNKKYLPEILQIRLSRVYQPDVIVSLTSYPARINTVDQTINSLFNQSFPADKIILWLAPEQFPNKEADLPEQLLALKAKGLIIDWYCDIRSYKKLIPTLKKYPNAIIITVDDDNIYNTDCLLKLYSNHLKFPNDILAHRITKIVYDGSFHTVSGGREYYKDNSYLNKLVGLGGVLYPVHCFYKDILDENLIKQLAPTNDDLWFWFMGMLNGVRVRAVKNADIEAHYIDGTQESGLTNINDHGENLFWKDFNRLLAYYPKLRHIMVNECKKYNIADYSKSSYQIKLENWFYRCTREKLDLHNPKTFNEKIQWLKLYASTPIKTKLADKYLVREWIKDKIGEQYLIPLLGVYNSFDDIDFNKLPNQFVIKCNHGCGYNYIVKDKSVMNINDARQKINMWLQEDFSKRPSQELHYRDIKHKIIIEKFIENKNAGDLYDYKFWCFNGKLEYIQFLSERNIGDHSLKMAFYDKNWKKQSFVYSYPLDDKNIKRPDNLEQMIELAEKLSKGFSHVRVDFYRLDDGTILFGEMTFSSMSGGCKWNNENINKYFGSLIKLPKLAYNIDTKEYYKLQKYSLFKSWMKLPYYLKFDYNLKTRYNTILTSQLLSSRIDIKNIGHESNDLYVIAENCKITKPAWMNNVQGKGYILEHNNLTLKFQLQIIGDGILSFNFRGIDKQFEGVRFPIFIDYKSIKIDSREILSKTITTWHNKVYRYEMPVKDNQLITVEISQSPHQYTIKELKNTILKYNSNSDYILNNIKTITKHLRHTFCTNENIKKKLFSINKTTYSISYNIFGIKFTFQNKVKKLLYQIQENEFNLLNNLERENKNLKELIAILSKDINEIKTLIKGNKK